MPLVFATVGGVNVENEELRKWLASHRSDVQRRAIARRNVERERDGEEYMIDILSPKGRRDYEKGGLDAIRPQKPCGG